MAISHIQTQNAASATSASVQVTLSATQDGDLLVASCGWYYSSTGLFSSIADAGSQTWTQIGSEQSIGTTDLLRVYYIIVGTGKGQSNHTVTFTIDSTNRYPSVVVSQFRGVAGTDPLDQTKQATGSGTSATTGATSTRSQADEILICAGINATADNAFTAGSGYSIPTNGSTVTPAVPNMLEYQIVSSTGTDAGTFSLASSAAWAATLGTFKAQGASVIDYPIACVDGSVAITGKAGVRLVNDIRQPPSVLSGVALTAVAGVRLVNHIRTPLVG